jgi:hypothetical protein
MAKSRDFVCLLVSYMPLAPETNRLPAVILDVVVACAEEKKMRRPLYEA